MTSKIKPIKPSLREKKRYLVFEIITDEEISGYKEVNDAIINSGLKFLGELGMAKAGVLFLKDKWVKSKKRGMLRVNNKEVDNIKASLTFIKEIDGKKAIVKSVGVSGIMKKAEDKYLKL